MKDNEKCYNRGCGEFIENADKLNCRIKWASSQDMDKTCEDFTTTPTTLIPTAELEQYKRLTSYGVGEIDRLQDKIAELEADSKKLYMLSDNCSDVLYGGESGWKEVTFKKFVDDCRMAVVYGVKCKVAGLVPPKVGK